MSWLLKCAAVNTRKHVYFQIMAFFEMPGNGIAESYGSSISVFWGIPMLFSIAATQMYSPTYSVGGLPVLHVVSSVCYL